MVALSKGRYHVRLDTTEQDLHAAQALRTHCFGTTGGMHDVFDDTCAHVLVFDEATNTLVASYRLSLFDGAAITGSYAAQFYDLMALQTFEGRMLELGRFCIHPDWHDPDILRIAWAAMTAYVDKAGVKLLFGCSSFAGTDAAKYLDTFALLNARHLAPTCWMPRIKAQNVIGFAANAPGRVNLKNANAGMPPLLRTYLAMGGWVSDHAVIDRHMDTLHVFTGLEIGAIPAGRKRRLRALV